MARVIRDSRILERISTDTRSYLRVYGRITHLHTLEARGAVHTVQVNVHRAAPPRIKRIVRVLRQQLRSEDISTARDISRVVSSVAGQFGTKSAQLIEKIQPGPDGALAPIEFEIPQDPEFHMGGGGLYGTAGDYLAFCRMILGDGTLNRTQVLQKDTVALMAQNHIGALEIGPLKTAMPSLSNDLELFPGMSKKWGLSFLINTQTAPTGRSANSLAWAGLANTYFWIDRTKRVCGVFLSQLFPFYDDTAIDTLGRFETAVYQGI